MLIVALDIIFIIVVYGLVLVSVKFEYLRIVFFKSNRSYGLIEWNILFVFV